MFRNCSRDDDFLDDLLGDGGLLARELQPPKERDALLQRPRGHLVDRARVAVGADLHVARLALQPRAVALGTRLVVQVLGELLAHHHAVGLAVAALEVRDDALERMLA